MLIMTLIIGRPVLNDDTNDMQRDDEHCPDILVSVPYDYCSSSISYRHAPWIMNDSSPECQVHLFWGVD